MVLDHVPHHAGLLVELAPAGDAETLGHGDLDRFDVLAIPDRLEERIREPEIQQILNGFLGQVVIDSEDLGFVERGVQDPVEVPGRLEAPAERLLEYDPGAVRAARLVEPADDQTEM